MSQNETFDDIGVNDCMSEFSTKLAFSTDLGSTRVIHSLPELEKLYQKRLNGPDFIDNTKRILKYQYLQKKEDYKMGELVYANREKNFPNLYSELITSPTASSLVSSNDLAASERPNNHVNNEYQQQPLQRNHSGLFDLFHDILYIILCKYE